MQPSGTLYGEDQFPPYAGDDLGMTYSRDKTLIRLWSPKASKAQVLLFDTGAGGYPMEVVDMQQGPSGTWLAILPGDRKGSFYTVRVNIQNEWSLDVPDPYAKAVGVNGLRAMITDVSESNPAGWALDLSPDFSNDNNPEDAVIYELHIRDLGMHPSSGITHQGLYLSLTENDSCNKEGLTTGIGHMKELGITHVHLLPVCDFMSVDETLPFPGAYNWGYDPANFFAPEGSYSSDPYNGLTRIRELKQAVLNLHKNGLRVVFDVVFNHTGFIKKSQFHQLVPGYYYRHLPDGRFSDASGCGTETASERPMFRKYMIDCLKYWLQEFHADGFRFDLMGIHDTETMRIIASELRQIKPDILLYGEGWAGGDSPYPHDLRAVKENVPLLNGIAVFSDDIRDAIKGKVFDPIQKGYVSGGHHLEQTIRAGIVASCSHPQVNYADSAQPGHAFATAPGQVISYCECHDNHTLYDKLAIANPGSSEEERKDMHRLALSIILTSQGIPFLHAGTEFLRSKQGVENSYKSPDSINAIDWSLKSRHTDLVRDIITLIHIRRSHPAFRLRTAEQVASLIRFLDDTPEGTVAYTIDGSGIDDSWKKIWVAMNNHREKRKMHLPQGDWHLAFPANRKEKLLHGNIFLPGISLMIAFQA